MNFFKLRQKSTGLYFTGGRQHYTPCFVEAGMRYDSKNPATAALNYCEDWNRTRPSYKEEAPGLEADNLEVVEFKEVEVGIIQKKK